MNSLDELLKYIQPLLNVTKNIDPTRFRSHKKKIEDHFESQFIGIDEKQVKEFILSIINQFRESFDMEKKKEEFNSKEKNLNVKIPGYKRFNDLVKEVDNRFPNIGFVVLSPTDLNELICKMHEPMDLLDDYYHFRGERKARCAVRFFREVAELLYEDYVRVLYELIRIKEGNTQINTTQSFGSKINELEEILPDTRYEKLLIYDAAWLRNATCHGRWYYDPEKKCLVLWDKKHEPESYSAQKLFKTALKMYFSVTEIYFETYLNYVNRKTITEWGMIEFLVENIESLLEGNKVLEQKLEEMLLNQFTWRDILTFKRANN